MKTIEDRIRAKQEARKAAPVLLAIVKDLAYGGAPFGYKVDVAREQLVKLGLASRDERALGPVTIDRRYDHCFYDPDKVFYPAKATAI